tara:strand:- start:1632 stop:2228 length:597 start_codon:yes stop_codon:yes gene_type:complete
LDLAVLRKYVDDVFGHHSEDADHDGKRRWGYVWNMDIANILGKVDEPTWVYMLESMIEWGIETRGGVQPNGRWRLCDWEIDIEDRVHTRTVTLGKQSDGLPKTMDISESRKYLVIGAEFVDVLGESDLIYEMGRPRTRQSPPPEPAPRRGRKTKAMKEAEAKLKAQDEELKELRLQQSKTQEMMALLLAELRGLKDES